MNAIASLANASAAAVRIRRLGTVEYQDSWHAMQDWTRSRAADTPDEIWLVQHPPVYTLGFNCRQEIAATGEHIPRVHTDRGGQITYHGPGQLIAYVLMDLRRRDWGVRRLVDSLEQSVISLLQEFHVDAARRVGAPGVYVEDAKIAALGLRVRGGRSYHGLALNVDMDLTPFAHIDPCGYAGLRTTDLRRAGIALHMSDAADRLLPYLLAHLAYDRELDAPNHFPEIVHG